MFCALQGQDNSVYIKGHDNSPLFGHSVCVHFDVSLIEIWDHHTCSIRNL